MAKVVCAIIGRFTEGREPADWSGRSPVAFLWDDDIVTFYPVVRGGIVWTERKFSYWPSSDPEGLRAALERDWGEAQIV